MNTDRSTTVATTTFQRGEKSHRHLRIVDVGVKNSDSTGVRCRYSIFTPLAIWAGPPNFVEEDCARYRDFRLGLA